MLRHVAATPQTFFVVADSGLRHTEIYLKALKGELLLSVRLG
jgi:hypothetical protein